MMRGITFLLCLLVQTGFGQSISVTPVTKENYWIGDVTLSADGRRIAYVAKANGDASLNGFWIRDTASLRGEKMPVPALFGRGMVFAPDGNSLYFIAPDQARPWVNHLYQWLLTGGEPRRIAERVDGPIAFSPDGSSFAFFRNLGHDRNALVVRNTANETERKLAEWVSAASAGYNPAWSPDGQEIACPGRPELLLVSVQTGQIRKVRAPGFAAGLAWPAHGGGLFALIDGRIWRHDIARSAWDPITAEHDRYGLRIAAAADGSTLAVVRHQDVMPTVTFFGNLIGLKSLDVFYSDVVLIHLAR